MKLNVDLSVDIARTIRVRQLESLFQVPATEKLAVKIESELPLESKEWNVGMIVGPSGSGKTLSLVNMFGGPLQLDWPHQSVIDDFSPSLTMSEIGEVCQAVGFNTIPAWMRPYSVLSNGERFRAEIARRLLESSGIVVVDEFTSVVDRHIAKIVALATQRFVRSKKMRLVVASCHYDIEEWLNPDWVFEPATKTFRWRELRRNAPELEGEICRVAYEAWHQFAPFHYMSQDLNKAARCFGLYVNGNLASFVGILHRPHPTAHDISGVSRVVTLPDWQGIGLAMILVDKVAAAYKAIGKRLHQYPNHPAMVRSYMRSANWRQVKKQGDYSPARGNTSTVGGFGGKACAVFQYVGPAMDSSTEARRLIDGT